MVTENAASLLPISVHVTCSCSRVSPFWSTLSQKMEKMQETGPARTTSYR